MLTSGLSSAKIRTVQLKIRLITHTQLIRVYTEFTIHSTDFKMGFTSDLCTVCTENTPDTYSISMFYGSAHIFNNFGNKSQNLSPYPRADKNKTPPPPSFFLCSFCSPMWKDIRMIIICFLY